MAFPEPLIPGTLIKRYKRFLADVQLPGGEVVTAHCANSGSMLGLCAPGAPVLLSAADNPKRKLPFTWEFVQAGDAWVCINTARPNHLVAETLAHEGLPELVGYPYIRREAPFGDKSRLDFLLTNENGKRCYVEVKSVTLRQGTHALFPDAVTQRGRKHLEDLLLAVKEGHRGVLLFIVQRGDCQAFRAAEQIDPAYAETLSRVQEGGVEVLCYQCRIEPPLVTIDRPLPMEPLPLEAPFSS